MLAKFDPRPFPAVRDLPLITRDVPETRSRCESVLPPGMIIDTLQHQVTVALSGRTVAAAAGTPAEFASVHPARARWSKVLPETAMRFD
jgi:hypothetical protein